MLGSQASLSLRGFQALVIGQLKKGFFPFLPLNKVMDRQTVRLININTKGSTKKQRYKESMYYVYKSKHNKQWEKAPKVVNMRYISNIQINIISFKFLLKTYISEK